jgi:hypothetical protein
VSEEQPEAGRVLSEARGRVALAAALLLGGLVAAIVIVSSVGSSGEGAGDKDCLEAWNSDVEALNFGVHNSISHGYRDVQVGYMPEDGATSLSEDPEAGQCAVVFAADRLDPEPFAAGQIYTGGRWVSLNGPGLLGPADLAQLQSAAVAEANATVTRYGKLIEKGTR